MDDRIRRIKKPRKKQQPVDVGLIVISLVGSTISCLLLGLLVPFLRWLILLSGAMSLIGGIALVIYVLVKYDEEPAGGIQAAPRSFAASFIVLLGIAQLVLYMGLAFRGTMWR